MIDSILRAQGYRTGLFTSPHLVTFRERIRVNDEMISEGAVADGLTAIRGLVADWNPHPTFFEIITALALKYFSEEKIDIVVLETGMGGRLDATNAVQSGVSVITSIDFDHQQWLGRSLRQIATEKAGIMKPKVPVICAPQRPEAEEVIRAQAAECETPIEFVAASYDKTPIALAGSHPSAPAKSKLTMRQLLEDLPRSIGRRVFNGGTNAQLSMARTIQPPLAFSPRHGAKSLAISPRRSFLPFFPTKICAASAKRSPRSAITSSCRKSAVSALLRRTIWQRYCLPLLHPSPTPSCRLPVKH